MAFSEIERRRCERDLARFLDRRRPPPHLRGEVDLAYRIAGHSVEIFEIRPAWRDPAEKVEIPVAKATFVRARNHWRVFAMRRDLEWHRYDRTPEVPTLEAFLDLVDRDPDCCFFG